MTFRVIRDRADARHKAEVDRLAAQLQTARDDLAAERQRLAEQRDEAVAVVTQELSSKQVQWVSDRKLIVERHTTEIKELQQKLVVERDSWNAELVC